MKFLKDFLGRSEVIFKDKHWAKFYPIYEMIDTFTYTPLSVTRGRVHIRDGIDLKKVMSIVGLALIPCLLMACLNTGFQINSILETTEGAPLNWRIRALSILGLKPDPLSLLSNFLHGLFYFLPIFLVTQIAGGICEVIFAVVRKHEINEGFFVTGILYPLTLPPNLPLWQVALGIIFGVVIGKEIFGGTGKNFLNPALTGRAFLYFAYPGEISGNGVWVAVDGYTQATPLALGASSGLISIKESYSWLDSFIGLIPGSLGETSTLACLIGAVFLIKTGIGSWRIMISVAGGMTLFSLLLYLVGSETNPMFSLPPHWHLVLGGFAFGTVFMATDPISGAMTLTGQYFYGALIGIMSVLIRTLNPAFPEGMMLAILFANCFAPLIDYFVVQSHIKRRELRTRIP